MPTLLSDFELEAIEKQIDDGIEKLSIKTLKDGPRTHLGISEIGEPCMRKLYYKFHWCFIQEFDGRMLRLFKRGHREEERFINYLEGLGCEVQRFAQQLWYSEDKNDYKILELDADLSGGTGSYLPVGNEYHVNQAKKRGLELKQFRVSGVMGHYGGSCDGIAITPWAPKDDRFKFLCEFKTHNQKSFDKYLSEGVHKSKPMHYDQMCGYGWKMNINFGIYFPENKNTDEIKVKVIKLDHERGMQLERKAEEIITAKEPPPKISENPAYFSCKYCDAVDICHNGKTPIKNCRSCRLSSAVEDAQWYCSRYNQIIPSDFIMTACDGWTPI